MNDTKIIIDQNRDFCALPSLHTTRINKKDAFLNDHFNHFLINFKLNALHYWKAQLLSFQEQKEKVLNIEAFRRSKKKSKNSQKSFSQFHKRKRVQGN